VRETIFRGVERNYICGFEGSQAMPIVEVMYIIGINFYDAGMAALWIKFNVTFGGLQYSKNFMLPFEGLNVTHAV
jgi:hypothetical protein